MAFYLEDLNNSEKQIGDMIEDVSYLMKLFQKEMEIGLPIQTMEKEEDKAIEENKNTAQEAMNVSKDNDQDVPMEENKEDEENISDLFGSKSESADQRNMEENKEEHEKFDYDNVLGDPIENLSPPEKEVKRDVNISNDEIKPKIGETVEKIADSVVDLTQKLHLIVDKLNTREKINHNIPSDTVAAKMKKEDVAKLCDNLDKITI